MELSFTPLRLLVLAVLIAGFALLGGFIPPESEVIVRHANPARAWLYCVLLFNGGAVSATIIDHYIGNLDRSNLRLLYILGGILAMIAGGLWLHSLKQALAPL